MKEEKSLSLRKTPTLVPDVNIFSVVTIFLHATLLESEIAHLSFTLKISVQQTTE